MAKADFERHHVLFQPDDKATYIARLLGIALAEGEPTTGAS